MADRDNGIRLLVVISHGRAQPANWVSWNWWTWGPRRGFNPHCLQRMPSTVTSARGIVTVTTACRHVEMMRVG